MIKGPNHLLSILIFLFCTCVVQAQNWQESYNATLERYTSENYADALIEGESALARAVSAQEKLYTLKVLSTVCYELEQFDKGIAYSVQEVQLCETMSVPDSVILGSINNLANNYLGNQDYESAIPSLLRILKLGQTLHQPSDIELNLHISDLGYSYYMIQKTDSAIHYLTQANKHLLTADGGAESYLVNQLMIGQSYYQQNELDESLDVFQELKTLLESNDLVEDQLYAETMEGLAIVHYNLGAYSNSQRAYESASLTYSQLGYAAAELEELNKQLALVYIKNENISKSDSVQTLLPNRATGNNLTVNQLSLAYKLFAEGRIVEAKEIVGKIESSLESSDELLLAEFILISTRVNLSLSGQANLDSIDNCINIFSNNEKKNKESQAHFVKSKILQANGDNKNALASLTTAIGLSGELTEAGHLNYNIVANIIKINLQSRQLGAANMAYQEHISTLSNDEFKEKISYTYAILLQENGYNFESKGVLTKLIKNAEYPALLNYQQAIAKIYLDIDQVNDALETYAAIGQYLETTSQNESVDYGENLAQLGRVYVVLGEYTSADEYYLRAIKLLEANSSTSKGAFSTIYNSYAIFQQTMGNYDKAKSFYSKASNSAVNNPNLQVDIIQNSATLSQSQGLYVDAITLFKEALLRYGEIYGKNHPYYATASQNLASAYAKNGEPSKAMSLLEQAIGIDKDNGLEGSISYINKLHNLGVMLQVVQKYDRAKAVFITVLDSRKNQLGDKHPDYIYSLYNMAVLMQKMKAYKEAKSYFKEVIEKYAFQIKNLFPYLSEEEKSKYYAKIKEAFSAFQDFAVEYAEIDPTINSDLYNFQINNKAILLSASKSMRKTIAKSNDSELMNLYEKWVNKKKILAKYYSASKEELLLSGISIEQLENESNLLERELSLKSKEFTKESSIVEKNWQVIQGRLQSNEAAVEIIRVKKNSRNDSVWYAALIIKPELTLPKLVVLKNGKQLENKFFKFYINSIKYKTDDTLSYTNYWQSIDVQLKDIDKIYLSSDGIYNKINVGSIYNNQLKNYVLDGLITHNVTNTFEMLEEGGTIEFDDRFSLNLIGDPLFSQTGQVNLTLKPLPSTRVEIDVIDSLAQHKNINSIKFLGAAAQESNIKNMESPSILHIATHGFFLADKSQSEELFIVGDHPLMKSGLLLSGAGKYFMGDHINFSESIDEEDNILTALEVVNMNLSRTDLVVLSACETGLGEVKNGEGVYGLQRAFVIAGAKSVLMSLWKVDDQTTNELMVLYYQNILNGIDKFDALNNAQNKLKEKYNHPYYWGAFIISGM